MIKVKKLTLICLSLTLVFLAKETLNFCFFNKYESLTSEKISNQHVIFKNFFILSLFEHEFT